MPGGREGRHREEVRPRRGARRPWRTGRRSARSLGRRRMAMADGQRRRALAGAEDDRGGRGRGGAPLPGRRTALAATGRRRASGGWEGATHLAARERHRGGRPLSEEEGSATRRTAGENRATGRTAVGEEDRRMLGRGTGAGGIGQFPAWGGERRRERNR
jgi:hypothetical protein